MVENYKRGYNSSITSAESLYRDKLENSKGVFFNTRDLATKTKGYELAQVRESHGREFSTYRRIGNNRNQARNYKTPERTLN